MPAPAVFPAWHHPHPSDDGPWLNAMMPASQAVPLRDHDPNARAVKMALASQSSSLAGMCVERKC